MFKSCINIAYITITFLSLNLLISCDSYDKKIILDDHNNAPQIEVNDKIMLDFTNTDTNANANTDTTPTTTKNPKIDYNEGQNQLSEVTSLLDKVVLYNNTYSYYFNDNYSIHIKFFNKSSNLLAVTTVIDGKTNTVLFTIDDISIDTLANIHTLTLTTLDPISEDLSKMFSTNDPENLFYDGKIYMVFSTLEDKKTIRLSFLNKEEQIKTLELYTLLHLDLEGIPRHEDGRFLKSSYIPTTVNILEDIY